MSVPSLELPAAATVTVTWLFTHGRAATLKEVLTKYNPQGLHGKISELSPPELDNLIEYLNSL